MHVYQRTPARHGYSCQQDMKRDVSVRKGMEGWALDIIHAQLLDKPLMPHAGMNEPVDGGAPSVRSRPRPPPKMSMALDFHSIYHLQVGCWHRQTIAMH